MAAVLLVLTLSAVQAVLCAEIDRTSYVTSVHDGDTFTLSTGERVRLADLDAPEVGEEGADEATDYLDSLVYHQTVYLDVDDKYTTDSFGRLVCVVYVDHNSTHYLNVNKALIDEDYVEARDYDNEFNYNSFELFLLNTGENGSGSSLFTMITIAAIIIVVLMAIFFTVVKIKR